MIKKNKKLYLLKYYMHNYIKIHIKNGIMKISKEKKIVVALKRRTTINFMCKFDKF